MDSRTTGWYVALRGIRVGLEAAQAACPYCEGRNDSCRYCLPLREAAKLVEGARYPWAPVKEG